MKQDSFLIQLFKMELYRNLTSNPNVDPNWYENIVYYAIKDVFKLPQESEEASGLVG